MVLAQLLKNMQKMHEKNNAHVKDRENYLINQIIEIDETFFIY